jgi:hypothetical protein
MYLARFAMPKDQWQKANLRVKYGPVREKQKDRRRKTKDKRFPPNFKQSSEPLYIVYAGTPAKVIRPDGTSIHMRTTKNLRFAHESKDHREDGCCTFYRFGHFLLVSSRSVGRQTIGRPR